ncbi:MAG: 30S ribosomal protein S17 [Planctomycetota bacterium]
MTTEASTNDRPLLGTKVGVVTSDKRDKTRTVAVAYKVQHPKYGKFIKKTQKFQVHDEQNDCKEGDRVRIARCRPLSKTKSWRLVEVVESALPPVTNVPSPEIEELAPAAEESAE